jgi:hypothetical protein
MENELLLRLRFPNVSSERQNKERQTVANTKFVVKVLRGGTLAVQYVQRVYPSPVQMTPNLKRALVMGKFTAEDVVKSMQNSRRIAELVSIRVSA